MLTKQRVYFSVVGLVFFGLGIPLLMVLRGQTNVENPILKIEPQTSQIANSDFKADFPKVEYYVNERNSDPLRKAKSEKYGKISTLDPNITSNNSEVSFIDWEVGLPALPVGKSDLVVIGVVKDGAAHLSANRLSVYSEFNIEIEEVLKKDVVRKSTGSEFVSIEREGGIVRFPSGFETWFYVAGQRMPLVGQKYLFFLTHEFPGLGYCKDDYFLLTAYAFKNGVVVPLDYPGGGKHKISTVYKGKAVSSLLNDLGDALSKPTKDPEKREELP